LYNLIYIRYNKIYSNGNTDYYTICFQIQFFNKINRKLQYYLSNKTKIIYTEVIE